MVEVDQEPVGAAAVADGEGAVGIEIGAGLESAADGHSAAAVDGQAFGGIVAFATEGFDHDKVAAGGELADEGIDATGAGDDMHATARIEIGGVGDAAE